MAELRIQPAGGIQETLAFFDQCVADGAVAAIVEPRRRPRAHDAPDIGACLALWTSGSTGRPRGLLFSHDRITQAAEAIARYLDLRGRIGLALPLHYSYALVGQLLAGRAAGVPVIDLRGRPLLEALAEEQITVFSGVPASLRALVEGLEDGGPRPPLHTICSAGAPLSWSLATRLRQQLPAATLWNQYGTTELGPRLAAIPDHDPAVVRALAAGRPPPAGRLLPGTEARCVDGVIEARTPWQTIGALDPTRPIAPDAWHPTGDLGALDDGLVTLRGRADRVLLVGGEKVHPATIEEVLESHGVVAAVVGRPHRRLGQVPIAFVVGDREAEPTLWAAIRAALPARCRPAAIMWLDTLPRLPSGKVDRAALT